MRLFVLRTLIFRSKDTHKISLKKAVAADRNDIGVPKGELGVCERKLIELGEVRGLVAGNFGEVCETWHALLAALATIRVRVAEGC